MKPAERSEERVVRGPWKTPLDTPLARDVLEGLTAQPKHIPSKYFYDAAGSELFRQITTLPEYYLTACERSIFEQAKGDLASRLGGGPFHFLELGPGDGSKAKILLWTFLYAGLDFIYTPVDISGSAISDLIDRLRAGYPSLAVREVVADFVSESGWLQTTADRPRFVLFAGSNIGNFSDSEALRFLRTLRDGLSAGDRLLIGFDLKKDPEILRRAYDDPGGVTAAFNLNLLTRINRELGGHFDTRRFRFCSHYDPVAGAIHSYLVSLGRQTVAIDGLKTSFAFEPWEPIWTERSRKYLPGEIARMAHDAGFEIETEYRDRRGWFVDSLWRARA